MESLKAEEFKKSLLASMWSWPTVSQAAREQVARELDALESDSGSMSWVERRLRRRGEAYSVEREYASVLSRLNAAAYARRVVSADSLAARFLSLVVNNLRLGLEVEPELDILFKCFPMLDALNVAEHSGLLRSASVAAGTPADELRLAIYENARVLDRRERHRIALQIGQQCAAWFTTRHELIETMGLLEP